MRQAVDAFMEGIPLGEYAEQHYELDRALRLWGIG
jgi:ribulose 1,5-bisphosphate carboxylase large subunit-like protein